MNKIFVFLVVLSVCASIGSALDCYQCSAVNSSSAEGCQDPFQTGNNFNGSIKTCGTGEVCVKQNTPEVTVGSLTIPQLVAGRGCAHPTACENEPKQLSQHCHTCSSNLCNSAITIIPSFTTVIVLYIAKLIFL